MAANIARARKSQQISLQELEDRLSAMGRRISFSGLSKIERGERRVDVDDLMAIAVSLDVSPVGLLLPVDQEPSETIEATGAHGSLALFWMWVMGRSTPFTRDDRAFTARSTPWWLEEGDIEWHGELELSIAKAQEDLRHILTITFFESSATEREQERAAGTAKAPWRRMTPAPWVKSNSDDVELPGFEDADG